MNNLLLEIGSEEIPAGYIRPALNALSANLLQRLDDARIDHGDAKVYGTPRRLAVIVKDVASKQKSIKSELVGPPANIGFDKDGNPVMEIVYFPDAKGIGGIVPPEPETTSANLLAVLPPRIVEQSDAALYLAVALSFVFVLIVFI